MTGMFLLFLAFAAIASALATPNTRFLSSRNGHAHAAKSLIDLSPRYLDAHNSVRAQHNAVDLVWNDTLADAATGWANNCQVQHSSGTLLSSPYGENLVAGTGDFPVETAVAQFVLDEGDYDPSNPTYNHFTQVVWQSTTQLGCAVSFCQNVFDTSAQYYVCLYSPPGNVIGQAPANVQV